MWTLEISRTWVLRYSRDRRRRIRRVRDRLPGWTCGLDLGDAGSCGGPPAGEPDERVEGHLINGRLRSTDMSSRTHGPLIAVGFDAHDVAGSSRS